ncbi:hypothetical protein [Verrucomicrobium sp. BvORR034]|uniref:hypothetical protein n=1 Tax=Verrucomicrobium sp. BvORR034 TaxID=1396418 RepID=UPI000679928F|nr:hypothetical protein [Verrucomicrobium sp. BvORR034]
MEVLRFQGVVPSGLELALREFEEQFTYPLGEGESFHVSHGGGYLNFFRAMGEASLFVVLRREKVMGTLVGVRRPMRQVDGRVVTVTYVCDLKVAPGTLRGRVLLSLGRALERLWQEAGGGPGYGVVMQGTSQAPTVYTGRGLLPGFVNVAELVIFRLPVPGTAVLDDEVRVAEFGEVQSAFAELTGRGMVPIEGRPSYRSSMNPVPLILGSPVQACGLVEDTRLGKQLVASGGREMKAAHLSHFAFRSADEGARLIRSALTVAERAGFPALFVCVPASRAQALQYCLADLVPTVAPAAVYGHNISSDKGHEWWVHSSEI